MFWKKYKQNFQEPKARTEWGLTVLAIGDIHGNLVLPNVTPDVVFLLGDIGYRDVEQIDYAYGCPKYGVLGNHDAADTFEGTSINQVHGKTVEYNGLKIGGFGGVPRYSAKPRGQYTEDEARLALECMGRVDVFLGHSNPASMRQDDDIAHRGFRCFDEYIKLERPGYFLHGHIHESLEVQRLETSVHSILETKLITI